MKKYNDIENIYKEYKELFNNIEYSFEENYEIDRKITKDNIKRLFLTYDLKTSGYNFLLKSFFKYYFVLFYLFLLSIFGKSSKLKKFDIVYEICDHLSFDTYFYKMKSLLKKDKSSGILLTENIKFNSYNIEIINKTDKYIFNRTISRKIFKKEFFNFSHYYKLSKKNKIDSIDIILRQLNQLALYETHSQNLESSVLISNGDNHFSPFRYYIYKKNGVKNILLIQNGARGQVSEIVPGEFYVYCDYYFAYGQKSFIVQEGMHCKNKLPVGSIQVSNFIENIVKPKHETEYDIIFIEQLPIYNHSGFVLDDYLLMISHLCSFKQQYPEYNIIYRTIIHKREMKEIKNKHGDFLDKFDKKMIDSGILIDKYINDNAYEAILKSRLVITYNSSMGVESLAMNKRILYLNYNKDISVISNTKETGVVVDKSYKEFEDKVLLLLNDTNVKIDDYYQNLKFDFMNVNGSVTNKIVDIITDLIKKSK